MQFNMKNRRVQPGEWVTHAQMRALRAIAGGYGHGWAEYACRYDGRQMPLVAAVDSDMEHEYRIRINDGTDPFFANPGRSMPRPNASGAAGDATGTGRVRWVVVRDGSVTLRVSRPAGDVLEVVVAADSITVTILNWDMIRLRHIEAVETPLLQLVDRESMRECLASALAWAQDNDLREKIEVIMNQRLDPEDEWVNCRKAGRTSNRLQRAA